MPKHADANKQWAARTTQQDLRVGYERCALPITTMRYHCSSQLRREPLGSDQHVWDIPVPFSVDETTPVGNSTHQQQGDRCTYTEALDGIWFIPFLL